MIRGPLATDGGWWDHLRTDWGGLPGVWMSDVSRSRISGDSDGGPGDETLATLAKDGGLVETQTRGERGSCHHIGRVNPGIIARLPRLRHLTFSAPDYTQARANN